MAVTPVLTQRWDVESEDDSTEAVKTESDRDPVPIELADADSTSSDDSTALALPHADPVKEAQRQEFIRDFNIRWNDARRNEGESFITRPLNIATILIPPTRLAMRPSRQEQSPDVVAARLVDRAHL